MDGHEKIRTVPVRDLHPIVKRNKNVAVARQAGIDAVSIELCTHISGDRQNDMFFQRTGVANGAGVDAAMTGIQHDQESFSRPLRFGARQAVGVSQRGSGAVQRQGRQPCQHHSAAR